MEREPIIPTRWKSKIPFTFSYPVGAEAISEALRDVPQFHEVSLQFRAWQPGHDRTAVPYCVIGGWCSGPIRSFSASRTMEEQSQAPRWMISVHAVPRSLRHEIRTKILAEALPSIRLWLRANTHSSRREGTHGLMFRFDELKNEVISEETASVLWQTEKTERRS